MKHAAGKRVSAMTAQEADKIYPALNRSVNEREHGGMAVLMIGMTSKSPHSARSVHEPIGVRKCEFGRRKAMIYQAATAQSNALGERERKTTIFIECGSAQLSR